jgi:hypothetical protein
MNYDWCKLCRQIMILGQYTGHHHLYTPPKPRPTYTKGHKTSGVFLFFFIVRGIWCLILLDNSE